MIIHAFSQSPAWNILSSMTPSKLPWYQFSLRSLLLLTIFVAVLCSLGVCTHWIFSAVMAIGCIAGRIVAGTMRFVEGALALVLLILLLSLGISCVSQLRGTTLMVNWEVWQEYWLLVIAAIVGGVLGGFRAGRRNWFDRNQGDKTGR